MAGWKIKTVVLPEGPEGAHAWSANPCSSSTTMGECLCCPTCSDLPGAVLEIDPRPRTERKGRKVFRPDSLERSESERCPDPIVGSFFAPVILPS